MPSQPFLPGLLADEPGAAKQRTIRVVSISGGKDSTATALICLDRYGHDDVRLVFADTGNEHQITIEYVTEYLPRALSQPVSVLRANFDADIARKRQYVLDHWAEKGVDQADIDRALAALVPTGNPFVDLCLWKGRFPSRRAQFCTQFLKRDVISAYLLDLMANTNAGVECWQGVRRDESQARANLAPVEEAAEGWTIIRPVLEWTGQQSVDYVRLCDVELNPLYTKGFARVGCAPCINSSKADVHQWSRMFPEMIDKIAAWEIAVGAAAKRGVTSFFPAPDAEGRGDRQGHGVRAFVEWSKTSHGGYQYDLIKAIPPEPACTSVYGLCE